MLLITAIIVTISTSFLIYASHIKLRIISIPSLFILQYFLSSFIGIIFLYYELDPHAVTFGVINQKHLVTLFTLSSFAVLTVCFTFLLLSSYTKNTWADFQTIDYSLSKRAQIATNCIVVSCLIITLLYLYALPEVPLFAVFRGDFAKAIMLRTTLSTTNSVTILNAQFFSIFIRYILPFTLYICIGQEMASRNIKTTFWTILVFVFVLFSAVIETSKGGFIAVIVFSLLIRMYINKKKLNFKFILSFLIVLLLAGSIMMKLFMGTKGDSLYLMGSTLSRIFTGNLIPAYHVLDLLEQKGDYYWGVTFPNPRGILPFKQVILEQEVWVAIMGDSRDSVYTAPFPYWVEMYANFGVFGVFIGSAVVGMVLFFLQVFSNSLPSNPVKIAFIIWAASYYSQLAVRGIAAYFFDYYFVSILIIVFIINYANKKRTVTSKCISNLYYSE